MSALLFCAWCGAGDECDCAEPVCDCGAPTARQCECDSMQLEPDSDETLGLKRYAPN